MITSGMVVFYIANVLAYATSARLAPARRLLLALRDAGERAEARTTPPPLFGNQKSIKAPPPNAVHFFIRGTQNRNYCGPRP